MDMLRGSAILLVVVFHAVKMLGRVDMVAPSWMKEIADFFALYRMPTLMFLSGLLLPQSLRKPAVTYFAGKLRSIWWPYLIWTVITAVVFTRDLSSVSSVLSLLNGGSYLWFLYFVGLFFIFAFFVRSFNFAVMSFAAFAISVVVSFGSPGIVVHTRLFYLMAFFFAGAFAGRHWDSFISLIDRRAMILALPVAIAGGCVAAYYNWKSGPAYVVLAAAFVIIACHLSRRIAGARFAAMLNFVGRNSLKFYVSHFPVIYIFDSLAVRAGLANATLLILCSIGVALTVGMLLTVAAERSPFASLLFKAPDFTRSRPAGASA